MSVAADLASVAPPRIRVTPAPPGDPIRSHRPRVLAFTTVPDAAADVQFEPRPTLIRELPDPTKFSATLVRNILDALECDRPLSQLMRWLDVDIYQSLARRVAIRSRQRRIGAPRQMVIIRRVRTCEVSASAVEVSVVAAQGNQVRAIALRLEALDHRWRCTALEIG